MTPVLAAFSNSSRRFLPLSKFAEVIAPLRPFLSRQPGVSIALWGARRPGQLDPVDGVTGWSLDADALAEIDRILAETVPEPIGPDFLAPPMTRPAG